LRRGSTAGRATLQVATGTRHPTPKGLSSRKLLDSWTYASTPGLIAHSTTEPRVSRYPLLLLEGVGQPENRPRIPCIAQITAWTVAPRNIVLLATWSRTLGCGNIRCLPWVCLATSSSGSTSHSWRAIRRKVFEGAVSFDGVITSNKSRHDDLQVETRDDTSSLGSPALLCDFHETSER